MENRILFVDDDPHVLEGYQRQFRREFEIVPALSGPEALGIIDSEKDNPFAVVIADMRMPAMSGIELLQQLIVRAPESVRVMLTGNVDQATATAAVNEGRVFRFLNKPCPSETLAGVLRAAINQHQLLTAERVLLEKTLTGAIRLVTDLVSMSDPAAYSRSIRLRNYVRELTAHLNQVSGPPPLPPSPDPRFCAWELELAAMLLRIGIIALPLDLQAGIRGARPLSYEESEAVSRIPRIGADLIRRIPRLDAVAEIIENHVTPYCQSTGSHSAHLLKILVDLVDLEAEGISRSQALRALMARQGMYDSGLLRAACEYFGSAPSGASIDALPDASSDATGPGFHSPARTSGVTIPLFVRDLQPGDRLHSPIRAQCGTILLEAGQVVTEETVLNLIGLHEVSGIQEPVYVVS